MGKPAFHFESKAVIDPFIFDTAKMESVGKTGVIMYIAKIYLIFGVAMLLVVLWDYRYLPKTASRLVKQPGDKTGFSLIVLSVRNLALMALFGLFLWPLVVVMELSGAGKK